MPAMIALLASDAKKRSPSEFYALGGILGIKCVGVFHEEVGSFAQGL
jgi:hypothetical protein